MSGEKDNFSSIISGDGIFVREMNGKKEIIPRFELLYTCSSTPGDYDDGIWERLLIIPYVPGLTQDDKEE